MKSDPPAPVCGIWLKVLRSKVQDKWQGVEKGLENSCTRAKTERLLRIAATA